MTVVAIDGPAGVGKSTIARQLAADLGWAYLDSGALYRAVTLLALRGGLDLGDAAAVAALAGRIDLVLDAQGRVWVDGEDVSAAIRSPEVTDAVSDVASVPAVREVMVVHQRRFARQGEHVVAEGRDIGTVVFPEAEVKIYLDAAPGERALRRLAQPGEVPPGADRAGVQADLEARDLQDSTRDVAPLQRAANAWLLDTSQMTLREVFEAVRTRVRSEIRR